MSGRLQNVCTTGFGPRSDDSLIERESACHLGFHLEPERESNP